MDSYLDRPVFPFRVNAMDPLSGSMVLDPEVKQYGGAEAQATSLKTHMSRSHDLSCVATSVESIASFFTTVRGAGIGFWLPLRSQCMTLVSGLSTTTFLCAGTALAARWGQSPQVYVAVYAPGAVFYRKVTSVAASGANSLVTVDSALPATLTAGWSVSLLLFVRLSSDEIGEIERKRYDFFTFTCSVVELPFEYGAAESPTAVIELYALGYSLGTVENWQYYTNWGVDVLGVDGTTFASVPISRGDITEDAEGSTCEVKTKPWTDCPFLDLFPISHGLPLRVKIWRSFWDWTNKCETGTRQLLFDGEARTPTGDTELTVPCQSGVDLYNRPILPRKSRECRARFCDKVCGLDNSLFTVSATVLTQATTNRYFVTVQAVQALPSDWLKFGVIGSVDYHNCTPSKYWEYRAIQAVADLGSHQYKIQVVSPFRNLSNGDGCFLYRGCEGTTEACKAQVRADGTTINNIINHAGEAQCPIENPQTVTNASSSSSKKG
jgi:hypothetical protein